MVEKGDAIMKKNNIFITTIVVLSLIIGIMAVLLQFPTSQKKYEISVIVPNSADNMWERFQSGIRQATDNDDINVNFVNTSDMETLADQKNLIDKEIRNGVDGLIVQFISSENTEKIIEDIASKTKLVLLLTDVDKYDIDSDDIDYIHLDDTLISTTVTSQLFDIEGRDLHLKKVGIVVSNENQNNIQTRIDNVTDILTSAGASISWTVSGSSDNLKEKFQFVDIPNMIVALDSIALDASIEYVNKNDLHLYGIGCSDTNIAALDAGDIQAMIVPDATMLGYYSVHTMYRKLKTNKEKTDLTVDYYVVDRENMFSDRNEQILFPIGD